MNHKQASGFSLLETMLVLALISWLLFAATPSMSDLLQQFEIRVTTHRLLSGIRMARMLAVSYQADMVLCGHGRTAHWNKGWEIYDSSGAVLRRYPALNAQLSMSWRGGFGAKSCLLFRSEGFTPGHQGKFSIWSLNHHFHKQINVTRTGTARLLES